MSIITLGSKLNYVGIDEIQNKTPVRYVDTDVSSASWVVDEDTMSSNTATKVSTQQASKAYLDTTASTKDTAKTSLYTDSSDIVYFQCYDDTYDATADSVATKAIYKKVYIDSHSCYSNTTGNFTPTVAGTYLVSVEIYIDPNTGFPDANRIENFIYKNGSELYGTRSNNWDDKVQIVECPFFLVEMNGTTDYLSMYYYKQYSADEQWYGSWKAIRVGSTIT